MNDADLRDLAAAYVLGALDPDEAREFKRLLAASPELAREVAELREVGVLLARGAPRVEPDPSLRRRVLDRVALERRRVLARPRTRWLPRLAWAAAVAGIVGAVLFARQTRQADARLATLERQRDSLAGELVERERILDAILGSSTVQFRLTSPSDPQPGIQVFWNRQTNVWVLHAVALRPAPDGRIYQLWFLRGGEAVPASTFDSEADGDIVMTVPGPADPAGLTGAAVTEEPAGGSPQPTSAPILVGTVQPQ